MYFERAGEGPPLLLVHGLGGSSVVWRPVRGPLETERELLVVDMPGFGRSDPLAPGTMATAANLAGAIAGLCSDLDLERPHVAGNSLGGWVALELAKAGGARSVCAISPAGLWRDPIGPRRFERQRFGRRIRPLVHLLARTRRGREALLRTTVAHPERVPARDARDLLGDYLGSRGYEDANRQMRAGAFEHEGLVEAPVTIAWGQADGLVGRPHPSRIPASSRVLTAPGWGHTPTWDDPEGVAALILEASDPDGRPGGR